MTFPPGKIDDPNHLDGWDFYISLFFYFFMISSIKSSILYKISYLQTPNIKPIIVKVMT